MESLFNGLNLKELFKCREALNNIIAESLVEHKQVANSLDINNYIKYIDQYVDSPTSVEAQSMAADLERLDMKKSANDDTKHLWLTELDQPYTWKSKNQIKRLIIHLSISWNIQALLI